MALHYWEHSLSRACTYEFSVHKHGYETVAFHDPENDWQFDEWHQQAIKTMQRIYMLFSSESTYIEKET